MGDLTGKLAGKPKARWRRFGPATDGFLGWHSVKCRINLDRREMPRIKVKPVRFRQIGWIKDATPVVEAPRARANAYFLLVEQIQMESKKYSVLSLGKDVTIGRRDCSKNLTGRIS